MTWLNPETDLRTLLSDGPTDKYRFRKKVFGEVDNSNLHFKTFEFRRLSDFTTVAAPLGVYVNGVLLNTTDIASDNNSTGDFFLVAPVATRAKVEASYYIQWFLDSEIQEFLRLSSNWLSLGDDYFQIPQGLRPTALKYAASDAYQKLSLRWAEHLSDGFLLNDAPFPKEMSPIENYKKLSESFRKEAYDGVKFYYSRAAQNLQPLFAFNLGSNNREAEPRR